MGKHGKAGKEIVAAAGVDNTHRRKWDGAEFAEKAAEREKKVGCTGLSAEFQVSHPSVVPLSFKPAAPHPPPPLPRPRHPSTHCADPTAPCLLRSKRLKKAHTMRRNGGA